MASLAAAIVAIVNRLDGVDGSIVHALPPEAYSARGRTRLNHSLAASADRVAQTAQRLTHLAAELSRGSEELHRRQTAWDDNERDRRRRQAAEQAEEARRADAARRR